MTPDDQLDHSPGSPFPRRLAQKRLAVIRYHQVEGIETCTDLVASTHRTPSLARREARRSGGCAARVWRIVAPIRRGSMLTLGLWEPL